MKPLRSAWLVRPLATLVIAGQLCALAQTGALADGIQDGATAAKAVKNSLAPDENTQFFTQDPNTGGMTLYQGKGSFDGLKVGRENIGIGDLFPGATSTSADQAKTLYTPGAESTMNSAAVQGHQDLRAATGSGTATPHTQAYSALQGSWMQSKPNLANDPMWAAADAKMADLGNVIEEFDDCSKQTSFTSGTNQVHMPDIKVCERVIDKSRSCTIRHEYKAGVLEHYEGPLNVSSCGTGCVLIWIGTVGDDYWHGNCQIFEENIKVRVFNPAAIQSATLEYAKWDDHMRVMVNGDVVWSGPDGNFPPETAGICELGTSWESDLDVNVTSYFKRNGVLEFKTRTSVTGDGEGYARIKVTFDPNSVVFEDNWTPPDCRESLAAMTDGFCQGTVTCTDSPVLDANGCAEIGGVLVCPGSFAWNTLPVVNPLCRQANIDAQCDFFKGQMECWTDTQGVQHCPINDGTGFGSDLTDCDEFEADPQCAFLSTRCVQDAGGNSGTCYVNEERWDCGYEVGVPTTTQHTTYQCPGPVKCMGTECIDLTTEQSSDFAEAAAALSAARMIAMDADCFDSTETNNNCQIFKGEFHTCKKAMAGIVDCCVKPQGVGMSDYLNLVMGISSLDSAISSLDATNPIRGAWDTLSGPFDSAWSTVKEPFVQGWESVWGGTEAPGSEVASEGVFAGLKQELMTKTVEWTADIFGQQAANSLFSVTTAGGEALPAFAQDGASNLGLGNIGLGGTVGTALSWVMTAYTIYQITMILIHLIWPCEKEEFELGMKRQLKNCHFNGGFCATKVLGVCIEKKDSYCCFNSPLSRILQEQIRDQLDIPWGEPKEAECRGLTVDELRSTDFSKVDLSEWMGLLSENGILPTAGDMNFEDLTGTGSVLNTGTRTNAVDRAVQRSGTINGRDVNRSAEQDIRAKPLPGSN